jgi:hypothetical protein
LNADWDFTVLQIKPRSLAISPEMRPQQMLILTLIVAALSFVAIIVFVM